MVPLLYEFLDPVEYTGSGPGAREPLRGRGYRRLTRVTQGKRFFTL
jgi:hypothetical protein